MPKEQDEGDVKGPVTTPVTDSGENAPKEAVERAAEGQEDAQTPGPVEAGKEDGKTETEGEEKSLLDVVQDVLKPDEKVETQGDEPEDGKPDAPEGDSTAKKSEAEAGKEPAAEKDEDFLTDDEMKALQPRVRTRISTLTRKRKEAEEAAEEYRPRAEQFDKVMSFLDSHGMSGEDMANDMVRSARLSAAGVTAQERDMFDSFAEACKSNPAEAYRIGKPVMDALAQFMGEQLPSDLEQEVQDGLITEQRARELASSRNRSAFEEQRSREMTQQRQQQEQQRETEAASSQASQEIAQAVNVVEAELKATDPDYATKSEEIYEQIEVLAMRAPPTTPEQGAEIMRQAYKIVSDRYSVRKGRRDEIIPTGGGGSQTPRTPKTEAPVPRSMDDVVELALRA